MKFICDTSALQDAVHCMTSVVTTRTPTPVLQCVNITASQGALTFSATDLEVGLRIGVEEVDVQEEGSVLVPAEKLAQIVRSSADPTLTIESTEQGACIRGADAVFNLHGYPVEDAPDVRTFDDSIPVDCELDGETLSRLISNTLFAAATVQSRYAVCGVLYERDGKDLRFVATEGHRLALASARCLNPGPSQSSCIIPAKALTLMNRLLSDPAAPVTISVEENQILVRIGEGATTTVISSNLVEASFPPFEDVVPRDQDKRLTIATADFASAIKRASLLVNEETKGVLMILDAGRMVLRSRAIELGDAEICLDIDYEGDAIEIGFNPMFLLDALKVVGTAEVTFELRNSSRPGLLKAGKQFSYVVMPVNLGSQEQVKEDTSADDLGEAQDTDNVTQPETVENDLAVEPVG